MIAKSQYAACTTVDEIAAITIPWPLTPDQPVSDLPE
jgi:hypothetical protein